jgi:hypothetical protein
MIHLPQAKSFGVFEMPVVPSSKEFRGSIKACDSLFLTSEAKHSFLCLCCNARYFQSSPHLPSLIAHDGDDCCSCRHLHPPCLLLVHRRNHPLRAGLRDLRLQHQTPSICEQSLSKGLKHKRPSVPAMLISFCQ